MRILYYSRKKHIKFLKCNPFYYSWVRKILITFNQTPVALDISNRDIGLFGSPSLSSGIMTRLLRTEEDSRGQKASAGVSGCHSYTMDGSSVGDSSSD